MLKRLKRRQIKSDLINDIFVCQRFRISAKWWRWNFFRVGQQQCSFFTAREKASFLNFQFSQMRPVFINRSILWLAMHVVWWTNGETFSMCWRRLIDFSKNTWDLSACYSGWFVCFNYFTISASQTKAYANNIGKLSSVLHIHSDLFSDNFDPVKAQKFHKWQVSLSIYLSLVYTYDHTTSSCHIYPIPTITVIIYFCAIFLVCVCVSVPAHLHPFILA